MTTTDEFTALYSRGEFDTRTVPPKPADFSDAYLKAPNYYKENRRNKALWYYRAVERDASDGLRGIGELAKSMFGINTVLISFLDDAYRTVFSINFDRDQPLEKADTFCAHTVLNPTRSVFLVPDTLQDWRFADGPRAKAGVRFYAGSPLLSQGAGPIDQEDTYALGTICLVDNMPHDDFDNGRQEQLNLLADMVMGELNRQLTVLRLKDRDRMSAALVEFHERHPGETEVAKPNDVLQKASASIKAVLCVDETGIVSFPERGSLLVGDQEVPCNEILWDNADGDKMCICVPVLENIDDERPTKLLYAYTCNPRQVLDRQDAEFVQHFARFLTSYLQAKLIERINNAKSTFMQSISHELRTPLHGVLTTCDLLNEMGLGPTEAGMITVIASSGKNLLNVINGLLDFHQYETQAVRIQPVDCGLLELQQDAADAVALSMKPDVRLLLKAALPQSFINIHADASLVRQVFLAILSNSIKFTTKGRIEFEIHAEVREEHCQVLARVSDTGIGMQEDFIRTRLFEPFQKEDSFSQGIGLGLTSARSIARGMSGDVKVLSSIPGEGTTMEIDFVCPRSRVETEAEDLSSWHYEVDMVDSDEQEDMEILLEGLGLLAAPTSRHKRKELTVVSIRDSDGADSEHAVDTKDVQYGLLIHDPESAPLVGEAIGDRQNLVSCPRPVGPLRIRKCLQQLARARSVHQQQAAKTKSLSDQNLRVLIVDDNQINRSMLAMFCQRRKMRFTLAVDGKDAFDTYVRKHYEGDPFQAVLMDVQMPVLDGPGSIRMIRAFEKQNNLEPSFAVMLTGVTDETLKNECLKIGADGYYTKPVSLAAIDAIMQGTFTKNNGGGT